jgi:hypothetical protein
MLQNFPLFSSESFIIPSSDMSVKHPVACVIEICIGTVNATVLILLAFIEGSYSVAKCFGSVPNHLQAIYITFL